MEDCQRRGTMGEPSLFIGYFADLGEVLTYVPEGGRPGNFFVNGESSSIWVWDEQEQVWVDTNRPLQQPLSGIVADPLTYKPAVKKGIKGYFLYLAGELGEVVFAHFRNRNEPLRVNVERTSLISLFWDGDFWKLQAVPLRLDPYVARGCRAYRFTKSVSPVEPPSLDRFAVSPGEGWVGYVPSTVAGEYVWMIRTRLGADGDFADMQEGWSEPVSLAASPGSNAFGGASEFRLVLSADVRYVPTSSDGLQTDFRYAVTRGSVYEGTRDVSGFYTFSSYALEGVSFDASEQGRTIAVTGAAGAGSSYVELVAERAGCPTLRKRFSVTKVRPVTAGQPAVAYNFSVSSPAIRKAKDGSFFPENLQLSAYRQASSEEREPSAHYLRIMGVTAASTQVQLYFSAAAETGYSWPVSGDYVAYRVYLHERLGVPPQEGQEIPVLQDSGSDGAACFLRLCGAWHSDEAYASGSAFRDVVWYDARSYSVRAGAGEAPAGTLPTDTAWWEPFVPFGDVAVNGLLADRGFVEAAGAGALRVGSDPAGCWELTDGAIAHSGTGLQLTANGRFQGPAGGLMLGSRPLAADVGTVFSELDLFPDFVTLALRKGASVRNYCSKASLLQGSLSQADGTPGSSSLYLYTPRYVPFSGTAYTIGNLGTFRLHLYFYDKNYGFLEHRVSESDGTFAVPAAAVFIRYAVRHAAVSGVSPAPITVAECPDIQIMLELGSVGHAYELAPEDISDSDAVVAAIALSGSGIRATAGRFALTGALSVQGTTTLTGALNLNDAFRVFASGAVRALSAELTGELVAGSIRAGGFTMKNDSLDSPVSSITGAYATMGAGSLRIDADASWMEAKFDGGEPFDPVAPTHGLFVKYVAGSRSGADMAAVRIQTSGATSRNIALDTKGGIRMDLMTTNGSGNAVREGFTVSGLKQVSANTTISGEVQVKVGVSDGIAYLVLANYTSTPIA